jgi:hypothetical protein
MSNGHPLHKAVAKEIASIPRGRNELLLDPACGGEHQLPLFMGSNRSRERRMCLVDALVLASGRVKVIVEIEESGFLPTKIGGKFLTSALATHFIRDTPPEAIPFAEKVLFVQVLDGSKSHMGSLQKRNQAVMVKKRIQSMLSLMGSSISNYELFLPIGISDKNELSAIRDCIGHAITESK